MSRQSSKIRRLPPVTRNTISILITPSDLKNTVLLVWKHPGGDDDRWLYLPALDLAKRIAASDKRTSFLGSDFLYEDISGRGMNADTHQLIETTKDYYVLKNIPREPDTVEFSEYTMWIHRQTFLPVKVEYLDKQGKKYRVYEALEVETIQGYPTITRSRMQDLALKQESTMEFTHIKYDRDLPEDIFTERYLRNPPTRPASMRPFPFIRNSAAPCCSVSAVRGPCGRCTAAACGAGH